MKKVFILIIIMLSMMLFSSNVLAYEEYKVGDKIEYNGEDYYVINSSDSSVDYVTLLKSDTLTVDEVNKYAGGEYESKNGGIPYYLGCDSGNSINCTNDYTESLIKIVLDNWAKDKLSDSDLVEIDGYKVRLITLDELIDKFGYILISNNTQHSYQKAKATPDWVYNSNYSYWTMSGFEDSNVQIYKVQYAELIAESVYNNAAVRPVINLDKCALGDSDNECLVCANGYNYKTEKVTRYKEYNIGDEIEYLGEKYYVIEKSNKTQSYVTLLKDQYLTYDEIKDYVETSNIRNNNYFIHYEGVYDDDKIMKMLNSWVAKYLQEEDLVEVDGYKVRLINQNDLITNLGCFEQSKTLVNGEWKLVSYKCSSDNNDWLFDYRAWTMITGYNKNNFKIISNGNVELNPFGYGSFSIRPVINVKKEKVSNKEAHSIGDIVTYQHDDYYVINNVKEEDNYITLLKATPLNEFEVSTIEYYYLPYYINGNCDNTSISGCSTEYNKSYIKSVIDFWKDKFLNDKDLVEVNGYKARLLTTEEAINNLGYDYIFVPTSYDWWKTEATPDWAYSNTYWSMSPFEDSSYLNSTIGTKLSKENVYNLSLVRPVINLDKCVLDGGCGEETVEVKECIGDNVLGIDDTKTTVGVGNTLKIISNIVFIISIILIIGGLGILGYNYIKSKKELKR